MVTLFKHLVKVAVSTLLIAVALNWYARHQGTLSGFVRRFQVLRSRQEITISAEVARGKMV